MTLTFGSADGSITVMHYPGEPCVVSAGISIPASDDPLVQILVNGGMTVPATGLDVRFTVHILRNAHDPAESVTLSGTWKATGDRDTGGSDPRNCNGSGAILASLVIQRVNPPAVPNSTSANLPGGAHTDDPIWTNTGEVSHADRDDLVLGGPLPLRFVRYYASLLSSSGIGSALGNNWMHNFEYRLIVSGTTATVSLFGGKKIAFQGSGNNWQLTNPDLVAYQLANGPGTNRQFMDPSSNLIYTFDASGVLIKIEDRNGNGHYDEGEGVKNVVLDLGSALTMTGVDGRYSFYNIAPGPYSVVLDQERLIAGYAPASQAAVPFVLKPDHTIAVAQYSSGPIGRLVWQDVLALVQFQKKQAR